MEKEGLKKKKLLFFRILFFSKWLLRNLCIFCKLALCWSKKLDCAWKMMQVPLLLP